MSEYYQEQVRFYMMRRAQRRLEHSSAEGVEAQAEANGKTGGWLARLGTLLGRQPVAAGAPPISEKRTGPARSSPAG